MNESRDKFLTELMGGCWHEPELFPEERIRRHHRCSKCKKHIQETGGNPDFSTWGYFGVLWRWVRQWNDENFSQFMGYLAGSEQGGTVAFMPVDKIDPDTFANEIAKFWGWKEGEMKKITDNRPDYCEDCKAPFCLSRAAQRGRRPMSCPLPENREAELEARVKELAAEIEAWLVTGKEAADIILVQKAALAASQAKVEKLEDDKRGCESIIHALLRKVERMITLLSQASICLLEFVPNVPPCPPRPKTDEDCRACISAHFDAPEEGKKEEEK